LDARLARFVLYSTFLISHFELFGLTQVVSHFLGHIVAPMKFKTPGLYRPHIKISDLHERFHVLARREGAVLIPIHHFSSERPDLSKP
jgi:hypothetical protein